MTTPPTPETPHGSPTPPHLPAQAAGSTCPEVSAQAAGSAHHRGSARPAGARWWSFRTLRSRLIVMTVVILVVIGTGIGTGAVVAVRSALMHSLDQDLLSMASRASGVPQAGTTGDGGVGAGGLGGNGFGSTGPGDAGGQASGASAVDEGLRFLFQPGQGDGAIAVVTDGRTAIGMIARASQGVPEDLPTTTTEAVLGTPLGAAPSTRDLPEIGAYRLVAVTVPAGGGGADVGGGGGANAGSGTAADRTIVYGIPQTDIDRALARTGWTTVAVVALGVLAAALVASALISRQLKPLRQVARTATEVSALDLDTGESVLDTRLPADLSTPGSEVGEVGAAMNLMLDNVDTALQARYASEQRMRRFVADASHELRTPLTTIRGYADLTRSVRGSLPAQVATSLERIETGAVRMSGLVDDLMLLARLDAGREPREIGPVDVSALAVELVEDAHVTSPDHRFTLDVPEEPVTAFAIEGRLRQVIGNVLTNARVHTLAGTHVHVALRAAGGAGAPVDASGGLAVAGSGRGQLAGSAGPAGSSGSETSMGDGASAGRGASSGPVASADSSAPAASGGTEPGSGLAVLTIADDGPGIPESIRDSVFERFVTAGEGRSRSSEEQTAGGSSGLGLSIARALMEHMGGRITVESPTIPGTGERGSHGTTFTLTLPLATSN